MTSQTRRGQVGQSLIFVGIAVALLFGILALALDTGNLYQVRRSMQNAADAGALAGARELCFGSGDHTAAAAAARDYAENRNGATTAVVQFEGADDAVVVVTANITATTFMASMIGTSQSPVSAVAKAACGVASSGCGMWPITLRQAEWDLVSETCGREFVLWTGEAATNTIDCSVYNCDVLPIAGYPRNPPGPSDILDGPSRAWLDFSNALAPYQDEAACEQNGCGASELGCWIEHDSGGRIEIGDCVGGDNGTRGGTFSAVNSRSGDIVRFPTFDINCTGSGNGACAGRYRVSGFGCVEVVGMAVTHGVNYRIQRLPSAPPGPHINAKLIHVRVACDDACNSACGGTGGGGLPGEGEVGAVSLVQ